MAADNDDDVADLLRAAERDEVEEEEEEEEEEEREERIAFVDPLLLIDLPALAASIPPHPGLAFVIKSEWRYIRSYTLPISRNMTHYNLRWTPPTGPRLRQYLQRIFDNDAQRPLFIVAMAGFYLGISDTEAGLFYAEENTQIFPGPSKLRSQADLDRYVAEWPSSASIIRDFKHYFDTQVKVLGIANVLFLVVTPANRLLLPG